MARNLEKILGDVSPQFATSLHNLEKASGNKGIDVGLIADINAKGHAILEKLGFHGTDVSAYELYQALIGRVKNIDLLEDFLFDYDYVLVNIDGEAVSCNLLDVIENYHHNLSFENRIVSHAQRALRGEILDRYLTRSTIPSEIVQRFSKEAGILMLEDKHYPRLSGELLAPKDSRPKILAIGDIFSDAFIELDERYTKIENINGEQRLSLPFGSKPPYKSVEVVQAVGPSPNAAVSFARLGLESMLMSWLGDDQPAQDSLKYLASQDINSDLVDLKSNTPSNYYYVLKFGADRTILVKNQNYDYVWKNPKNNPDWVYLSLISKDSWQLHEDLLAWLDDNPEVKLAFQPGTFHFEWGVSKLERIYRRSEIVIMNREEAVDVTGGNYDDLRGLAEKLNQLGPRFVVITDGPNGSYAYSDGKLVTIPNYPDPGEPVDRTGAGDAFASTIVAMMAKGKSFEEAISFAPINSMNVVQHLGAQKGLLTEAEINKYLDEAPEWYKVKEI